MNRNLRYLSLLAAIFFVAACKNDDDNSITPPRPYDEQYAVEKPLIEEYLKTHYIASVDADFNVQIDTLTIPAEQTSIWDQTTYPLQNKQVSIDDVEMTLYYLVLNEGVGKQPTRADNVLAAYRGFRLDGTQFDYNPFPQVYSSLAGTILGWRELMPLFRGGEYIDEPGNPDPASFQNYGAGVMFLPSAFGYYNSAQVNIPSYSPLIFSFKLFDITYADSDGDGILNKDETIEGVDIADYDTDGDDIPNYLDTDDDGDGYTTRQEIEDPLTGEAYDFEDIPPCEGGIIKKHLDPACF
ncbi:FKBP-type peptidylprolyl isomerase [Flavobacterium sp.]|uniref:FKBP-type peptidyl-prolyl cis-trans isomerase n=1 Tax=Flavobacterium sp. TaxID=239 RepID=UPI002605269C|nr:FKBP-type peptidylprolyl isomerase [Flavobacterium sp.]